MMTHPFFIKQTTMTSRCRQTNFEKARRLRIQAAVSAADGEECKEKVLSVTTKTKNDSSSNAEFSAYNENSEDLIAMDAVEALKIIAHADGVDIQSELQQTFDDVEQVEEYMNSTGIAPIRNAAIRIKTILASIDLERSKKDFAFTDEKIAEIKDDDDEVGNAGSMLYSVQRNADNSGVGSRRSFMKVIGTLAKHCLECHALASALTQIVEVDEIYAQNNGTDERLLECLRFVKEAEEYAAKTRPNELMSLLAPPDSLIPWDELKSDDEARCGLFKNHLIDMDGWPSEAEESVETDIQFLNDRIALIELAADKETIVAFRTGETKRRVKALYNAPIKYNQMMVFPLEGSMIESVQ